MAKAHKTVFFCTECGNETLKWEGRCPHCGTWNTLREGLATSLAKEKRGRGGAFGTLTREAVGTDAPVVLGDVEGRVEERLRTSLDEFDFVLGGGIVRGSMVLLGGAPGVGKSTILMQMAGQLHASGHRVLYVSGEESASQVKLRAMRLGARSEDISFLAETEVGTLLSRAMAFQPDVLVVDSIQTLYVEEVEGAPGRVAQLEACGAHLRRYAKDHGVAVFIVGHVTKDGQVGGPMTLQHVVDTVIVFEHCGDGEHRLMRATKNRFGPVDEIGVFRMTDRGLEPVTNPSEVFLADRAPGSSGSAVTSLLEGTRPLLVEVQGLVTLASYGSPQRVATGFSRKRLALLVAVLEKRVGLPFSQFDAFLNIAGGLELREPAGDAAVCAALASSAFDRALPADALFLGEVGLGGELRRVGQIDRRLAEAARMGFRTVYLADCTHLRHVPDGIRVVAVDTVATMIRQALGVDIHAGPVPAAQVTGRGAAQPRQGTRSAWRRRTGGRVALRIGREGGDA